MRVVLLFTRISILHYYVHIYLVMSTYFLWNLLHFLLMFVLYVLLMNGATILFWVGTWCFLFNTSVIRSDVEPTGSWGLDFGYVSFGTIVRHSDVEPPGSWRLDFGPPGSWLMSGLVSPSSWLIHPHGGNKLRLWLVLCSYSCLISVWWIGRWCLVK